MRMKSEPINVLWTGGLDSTYRVLELVSQTEISIQPYYVIDKNRRSYKYELKAINEITAEVNNRCREQRILPLKTINLDDIRIPSHIDNAFRNLHDKYSIGSQYAWLASLAELTNVRLEVGLENSPRSKALNAIKSEGKLIETPTSGGAVYYIEKSQSSNDINLIFGNFHFPKVLWNTTKPEEVDALRQYGFGDLVTKTWFCHNPVLGKPCGRCNPCKDALNEGMEWRVPILGRILGSLRIPISFVSRAVLYIRNTVLRKIKH